MLVGSRDRIDRIIDGLYGQEKQARRPARDELRRVVVENLSVNEATRLINASRTTDPVEKFWFGNAQYELIWAFYKHAKDEYIPPLLEVFPHLMEDAKRGVLRVLTSMRSKRGAEAFMQVLRVRIKSGELTDLDRCAVDLEKEPMYPDIYYPEILEYAKTSDLSWPICSMTVDYIKAGKIDVRILVPYGPRILQSYNEYRRRLTVLRDKVKKGLADKEEYAQESARSEAILELLGYIPGDAAEKVLRGETESKDAHTVLWAVVSLLRQGKEVDPRQVEVVAANAETRNTLYDQLHQLRKSKLFPKQYRTQEAFAESQMVNWLSFPTELGCAPDEIVLMKLVSEDVGGDDGVLDLYLFKFRSDSEPWKEKGWMAGVAGAYKRKDEPTTISTGCTFSELEPWDSKTTDQHVDDALQYIADLVELTKKKDRQP